MGPVELSGRYHRHPHPAAAQQEFGRFGGHGAADEEFRQVDEDNQANERRKGTRHRAARQAWDVLENDRGPENDNEGLQNIIDVAEELRDVAVDEHISQQVGDRGHRLFRPAKATAAGRASDGSGRRPRLVWVD